MEKIPRIDSLQPQEKIISQENQLRDIFFGQEICERLEESFENDFLKAGGSDEQFQAMISEFERLELEDRKKILAIPKEIRGKRMDFLVQQLKDGKKPEILTKEILLGQGHYTIGYHLSNSEIPQKENGDWTVIGTELDDRDDRKMAYYSLDYQNLYKKKPSNYIYIIRADTSENSAHKKDLGNNWGRAVSLSIIEGYNIQEILEAAEKRFQEYIDKKESAESRIAA